MISRLGLALVLFLAGCAGTPVATTAPPPPLQLLPLPAFQAAWSGPSLGVALSCDGWTPLTCTLPPGAVWGTLDRPGDQGQACVDPNPNPCYAVRADALYTNPVRPGFPLISAATFSKDATLAVEADMAARCDDADCWGGIVLYNGDKNGPDGEWCAIYYAKAGDGVALQIWSPTLVVPLVAAAVRPDVSNAVRLTYRAGVWTAAANDNAVPVTSCPALTADPHVAIFAGPIHLTVSRLQVFVTP